jgi:hypothetical protein
VFFSVKLLVYLYFVVMVIISWLMKNAQMYRLGNFTLIIVPIYAMCYSNYVFSARFGRLRNNNLNTDLRNNEENARADVLIPEDAIL